MSVGIEKGLLLGHIWRWLFANRVGITIVVAVEILCYGQLFSGGAEGLAY